MKYILEFIFFIVLLFVIYAIIKERKVIGCNRLGIDASCHYDNSLMYMKTDPNDNNKNSINKKLKYIITNSIGSDSSSWRKILIFSFILSFFLCVAFYNIKKYNICLHFLIAMPIIMLLIFGYERFNVYHYNKIYENNALDLLQKLQINL